MITQRILKRFTRFGVCHKQPACFVYFQGDFQYYKKFVRLRMSRARENHEMFWRGKVLFEARGLLDTKTIGMKRKISERTLNCTLRDKRINVHLFNYLKEVTLFSHCFFALNRTFLCFPFNCHSVLLYKFWSRSILRMYFSRQ